MRHNPFHALPEIPMGIGGTRKLLAYEEGENAYTVTLMNAKPDTVLPLHSHPHKQMVYVLSGKGNFRCGDEIQTLISGDVVQISADVPHTFESFAEATVWMKFFTPCREDFKPE